MDYFPIDDDCQHGGKRSMFVHLGSMMVIFAEIRIHFIGGGGLLFHP